MGQVLLLKYIVSLIFTKEFTVVGAEWTGQDNFFFLDSVFHLAKYEKLRRRKRRARLIQYGGGYYARIEPEAKGLVRKRMTVDEYLAHQPDEEKADSGQISSILDSEAEVWNRVWWRLLDEQFLGWYIWLKDNLVEVKEWVEEVKEATVSN